MKIYQKKNGKWMIDFTYRHRRIRKVVDCKDKKNAEAIAIRIKNDIVMKRYGIPTGPRKDMMFEGFANKYYEEYSRPNKRAWIRDRSALKHLKSFFRRKTLSQITPDMVERYKVKRKNDRRYGDKEGFIQESTINQEIALLKSMFNKAIQWKLINENPAKGVKLFRLKPTEDRMLILSDDEMRRLLLAAEESSSSHLKPFITIALNTGMRKMEILALMWKNINFSKGYIYIENSKGGRSRKVPLNDVIIEVLRNIPRKSEHVFFNEETGKRLNSINHCFEVARKRANLKGITIHTLRHNAASRMLEAGANLQAVKEILGHSKIEMTARYLHANDESRQRAIDMLGEIFEKSRHKVVTSDKSVKIDRPIIPLNTYN